MITWYRLFPLMILPYMVFPLGLIPVFEIPFLNKTVVITLGGQIRMLFANMLMPYLPTDAANDLYDYFNSAGYFQEVLVFMPAASVLFAFLTLLIWLFGELLMMMLNTIEKKQRTSVTELNKKT